MEDSTDLFENNSQIIHQSKKEEERYKAVDLINKKNLLTTEAH